MDRNSNFGILGLFLGISTRSLMTRLGVRGCPGAFSCVQGCPGLPCTHILDENPKADLPPLIPPWKGWKLRANPILPLAKGELEGVLEVSDSCNETYVYTVGVQGEKRAEEGT